MTSLTGSVENKRRFIVVDGARGGAPDGGDGRRRGLPLERNGLRRTHFRYSPDGRVDRVIEMPVVKITSPPSAERTKTNVRHLDGRTAAAEIPRRRANARQRIPRHGAGVRGRPEPAFAGNRERRLDCIRRIGPPWSQAPRRAFGAAIAFRLAVDGVKRLILVDREAAGLKLDDRTAWRKMACRRRRSSPDLLDIESSLRRSPT